MPLESRQGFANPRERRADDRFSVPPGDFGQPTVRNDSLPTVRGVVHDDADNLAGAVRGT